MAGVGDDLLDRAEVRERGLDERGRVTRAGEIAVRRGAGRASLLALGSDGCEPRTRRIVCTARMQHQRDATPGDAARERCADARARDQHEALEALEALACAHAATRSSGMRSISSVSWWYASSDSRCATLTIAAFGRRSMKSL